MPFPIDIRDPVQLALIVMIGGLLVVFLWLLRVIMGMSGRGEPFAMWQPNYPSPPRPDLDSQESRRYRWQPHAQHDGSLPPDTPCAPGTSVVYKQLVGAAGENLLHWRLVGVRTGRYDTYGRIARTHHTLSSRTLRTLARAARRRRLTERGAKRAAAAAARTLVRDIMRSTDARTGMLPIALDVRFRSDKPGAGVQFHLLTCGESGWESIDSWLSGPSVSASGEAVDQFTYALIGQRYDETPRQMRARLHAQISAILTTMLVKPTPPTA